jgi:hypothetical protein
MALSQAEKASMGVRRTVRLLSNFPGLWQRTIEQTPSGQCRWGDTLFVADGIADHYVVLNSMGAMPVEQYRERLHDAFPEVVWGLHMEPGEYIEKLGYATPAEHTLASRFYTNSEMLIRKGRPYVASPPYVHFHTGKSWDFLKNAVPPRKTADLCVISSDLATLKGHVDRIRFLREIDDSDIEIDIWGRGKSLQALKKYKGFLLNKWDAHSRFKYSIVIENSKSKIYWTEKFADAILSFSLPLYHGATDIGEYFPEGSFIRIDITDPNCLQKIRDILREDPYESRLPAILEARELILQKQNLYAFLDHELSCTVDGNAVADQLDDGRASIA